MLPFFSFPVMNQAGRDKNWEEENLSLNLSYISRYEAHTQRTSSVSISSVLLSTCLTVLARSCEVPDDQISKYSKVSQKKLNCENTSRGFMLVFSDKARGKHEMRSYSERETMSCKGSINCYRSFDHPPTGYLPLDPSLTYIITSILQWDSSNVSRASSSLKLWLLICFIGFPEIIGKYWTGIWVNISYTWRMVWFIVLYINNYVSVVCCIYIYIHHSSMRTQNKIRNMFCISTTYIVRRQLSRKCCYCAVYFGNSICSCESDNTNQ